MQPWQWIADSLAVGVPVTLLIVVDSCGSAPRKCGAKMAVTACGAIGTIGGGTLEHDLVCSARESMFRGMAEPRIYFRAHHDSESGSGSGMICGGEQTVLAFPCRTQDHPFFAQLAECGRLRTPRRLAITRRGLHLTDAGPSELTAHFETGDDWRYQEVVGLRKTAYLIGGGHVSLMLCKVLDLLDIDSVVIDEREGIETMECNRFAWKRIVIPYVEIDKIIPEGPDIFLIVMTHSHQTDKLVLTQLAAKNVAYLGLLGSTKKIAAIKEALTGQFSEATLNKLHAPIGLPINSHTPAEIAISIAAEMIQFINSGH